MSSRNAARIVASLALALSASAALAADKPIQCQLDALNKAQRARQGELITKFRAAVASHREIPRGYLFDVSPKKIAVVEIAEWIDLEAHCCPFLDLSLEVGGGGEPVRVRLTGGKGAKEFIVAEMSPDGCKD